MGPTSTPTTAARSDVSDDGALLARSVRDPDAFEVVFERHHAAVFRYLVSRVGAAVAEDVLADTFLHAFATRRRFDPSRATSALPWLLGIATKRMARQRRAQAKWVAECVAASAAPGHAEDGSDRSIERADAAELAGQLSSALDALSAKEREPLLLHVLGGLTYEEVGVALDLPVGTVRSRISRARSRLAGLLDGVAR